MDSIDLNSVPINPPSIEKLDTVRRNSARPQNSTGSKSTAQHPLRGGCLGKGHSHFVDPRAIVEEKFQDQSPDFQKARDADLNQQRLTRSHEPTEKTRSTVKNSIRLGYILYEATTSSWVTFSYELTGVQLDPPLFMALNITQYQVDDLKNPTRWTEIEGPSQ